MTEKSEISEAEAPVDGAEDPQSEGGWDVGDRDDPMLAQLVAFAGAGFSVGVTFTVGGSLVSGTLCTGKAFIEHLRDAIVDVSDETIKDFVEPHFKHQLAVYEEQTAVIQIVYVHLRGAIIFNGGERPIPTNKGVFWRGRLDAIDGWSLGTLSSGK